MWREIQGEAAAPTSNILWIGDKPAGAAGAELRPASSSGGPAHTAREPTGKITVIRHVRKSKSDEGRRLATEDKGKVASSKTT